MFPRDSLSRRSAWIRVEDFGLLPPEPREARRSRCLHARPCVSCASRCREPIVGAQHPRSKYRLRAWYKATSLLAFAAPVSRCAPASSSGSCPSS